MSRLQGLSGEGGGEGRMFRQGGVAERDQGVGVRGEGSERFLMIDKL